MTYKIRLVLSVFAMSFVGFAFVGTVTAAGSGAGGGISGVPETGADSGIAPGTTPGQTAPDRGGDIGRTPGPGSPTQPGIKNRPGETTLGTERGPLPPATTIPPDSGIAPPPHTGDSQGMGSGLGSPTPGLGDSTPSNPSRRGSTGGGLNR